MLKKVLSSKNPELRLPDFQWDLIKVAQREKCSYSELPGTHFPAFGPNKERFSVFSPNVGKSGPE